MAEKKSWIKVKCHDCGKEQIIFGRAATQVTCNTKDCSAVLAIPTGGKAAVKAEIIELM